MILHNKIWRITLAVSWEFFILALHTVPLLDPFLLLPIEDQLHLSMSESPILSYLFPCGRVVLQETRLNCEKTNNNEQTIHCDQIRAKSSYCLLPGKLKLYFIICSMNPKINTYKFFYIMPS